VHKGSDCVREWKLFGDEYRVRDTLGDVIKQISVRTDNPIEFYYLTAKKPSPQYSEEATTNESFPRLVGRNGQEATWYDFSTNENSHKVSHTVVTNNERNGKHKPKETLKGIVEEFCEFFFMLETRSSCRTCRWRPSNIGNFS